MPAPRIAGLCLGGLGVLGLLALGGCKDHRPASEARPSVERAPTSGPDGARPGSTPAPPSGTHPASPPIPAPDCAPPIGTWYLHLSDIHLGASALTQEADGDTSVALWDATKAAIRERIGGRNPPDFILYTGDLPDHAPDRGELHTRNITAVLADLEQLAGTIPLLYLPGNNDSLDWDYASFTSAAGETALSAAGWDGPTLNLAVEPGANANLGYYSAVPLPGLRVVALNTVLMSSAYPCAHQGDAAGTCEDQQNQEVEAELGWLAEQLETADEAGQKVLVAMHIPPGVDAYQSPKRMWNERAWDDKLLATLAASPAPIVGLAFGHTHVDELRRLYAGGETDELLALALSAPGITPGHGNNPGFKAVSLDAGLALADALTWYASAPDSAAPVYAYADDGCYHYTEVFGCTVGSLADCLAGEPACAVAEAMNTIYTVKHGPPGHATAPGVDVRPAPAAPVSCASAP